MMSNQTPTSGTAGAPVRHTLRTVAIFLVTLLLLAGGGWWANQAGLLSRWLSATAQTASSVAAGVQAQAEATPADQTDTAQTDTAQADISTTPGAAASDAMTTTGALTTNAIATATPEPAAAADLVTIAAVAGVKGGSLYNESGARLATLEAGDSVLLTGRSNDNTWLAVIAAAGEGWVQAKELIAYGLARLPAVALPDAVAAVTTSAVTVSRAITVTAVIDTVVVTSTAADAPMGAAPTDVDASAVTATVVTDDGRLNLRAGPGTDYTILGKGGNGDVYAVVGRNAASDWLQLDLGDDEVGWASASYLKVAGDVEALPVQDAPAPAVEVNVTATAADDSSSTAAGAITLVSTADAASTAAASAAAADGLAGTLVFQQSPGGMIYAYNLTTGDLWPLTDGFDPAISPDGGTVAFVRDGGETGLYLIDIDGSNERRVFERAALSSPKWSTDGQSIVFTRNDEGVECYQVGPRMCLLPDEAKKRFPMGVPDTIPLVTEYQYKLSVVDASGDNYHDVASLNSARASDWSDAGIVYQSSAGIQITADAEGATTQEVAFDNLNPYYYDPDLQPGGGQIVFQRKGAAQTDLWVVNTDGSGMRALTQPRTTLVETLPSNVAAAYSPDGQHIVFLSNRTDSGEAGAWRLWVMDASGANQRQLPVDVPIDYTYGDDQVVSWGA